MKKLNYYFTVAGLLVLMMLNVSCSESNQPLQADSDNITKLISVDFKKAFDHNDAEAIANMFLSDADITFPTSPWIKGKDAIREAFSGNNNGTTGEFKIESIRFLDQSTAIVNVDAHFYGGKDKQGNKIPDYWDSGTAVMTKQHGTWKYAALRVMPAKMNYSEVKTKLEEGWSRFADNFVASNLDGVMDCFTENFLNIIPNSEVLDKNESRSMFKSFMENNKATNCKNKIIELQVIGGEAYEFGEYEDTITPNKGEPYNRKLRYYAIWKKDSDGVWRWHRFLFNNAL